MPAAHDDTALTGTLLAEEAEGNRLLARRRQELTEIDQSYGDALPYDLTRVRQEFRFFAATAAESIIEAGRRLILIKEHEPHGTWLQVLEDEGTTPRAAQRMMQAALRFGGERAKLARLGRAKLLELLTEDDATLDALAEGGTVAGATLDDVERMTRQQLRETLRQTRQQAREDAEAKDRLIADKNRKLDELDVRLRRAEGVRDPDTLAEQQAAALERDCMVALGGYVGLLQTGRAILEREDIPPHLAEAAVLALHRLEDRLDDLRQQLAPLFDAAPTAGADPGWRDEVIATLGQKPQ